MESTASEIFSNQIGLSGLGRSRVATLSQIPLGVLNRICNPNDHYGMNAERIPLFNAVTGRRDINRWLDAQTDFLQGRTRPVAAMQLTRQAVPALLKEVGELTSGIGKAFEDQQLTGSEASELLPEAYDVLVAMKSVVEILEHAARTNE